MEVRDGEGPEVDQEGEEEFLARVVLEMRGWVQYTLGMLRIHNLSILKKPVKKDIRERSC